MLRFAQHDSPVFSHLLFAGMRPPSGRRIHADNKRRHVCATLPLRKSLGQSNDSIGLFI
jgi:hypothetical protein